MTEGTERRVVGEASGERKGAITTVKIAGVCAVLLGIIPLIDVFFMTAFVIRRFFEGAGGGASYIALVVVSLLVGWVLPLAKVISGWGLFGLRRWARGVSVAVFAIDFALRLTDSISFCIQCYLHRGEPHFALARDVGTMIMWPSYVLALVSLLFIAVLQRPAVRSLFPASGPGPAAPPPPS